MERLILLDSGPLGMIVRAPSKPHVVRCLAWLKTILAAGAVVVIPDMMPFWPAKRRLPASRGIPSRSQQRTWRT